MHLKDGLASGTSWLNSGNEDSLGSSYVGCMLMADLLARGVSKGQGDSLGHLVTYKAPCVYSTLQLPKSLRQLMIKDRHATELTQKEIKKLHRLRRKKTCEFLKGL